MSAAWKRNTEEEALLGVSLTGIMDHTIMSGTGSGILDLSQDWKRATDILPKWLEELKQVAVETNAEWADKLGINRSAAITAIKPSGTVSQLVDSSSGIHSRHADYYIRTVRADKKDPMYAFMKDQGVPVEDAIGKEESTAVFSFPIKAPEGAITSDSRSAIEQLELWKIYQEHWCEHKPSVTITVKEDEWLDVGAWVYKHFDSVSGVSFLPHTNHVYRQAPYQTTDEDTYNELVANMPTIDWDKLSEYETADNTTVEHELACTANGCELL